MDRRLLSQSIYARYESVNIIIITIITSARKLCFYLRLYVCMCVCVCLILVLILILVVIFSFIVHHIVVLILFVIILSFHPGCDNSYLTGTLIMFFAAYLNWYDLRLKVYLVFKIKYI